MPLPLTLLAQAQPPVQPSALGTAGFLVAASLLPFLLLTLTSFVKISVVLSILRNAMGAPGMPPAAVTTGLALVLSVVVMAPVGADVARAMEPEVERSRGQPLASAESVRTLVAAAERASEPVRGFLARHAHERDRAMFVDLSRRLRRPEERAAVSDGDLAVLAPAFVTSELAEAFQIGFLLFLPFLVLDLLVASTLQSVGMTSLSPASVALPFKLLLFVVVNGWALVSRGLILGYA